MAKKKSTGNALTAGMPMPYHEPKSVNVTKAGNGFVVDFHTPGGRKTMIAKNDKEVMKHMKKLMK